jgi:hypothetical protein
MVSTVKRSVHAVKRRSIPELETIEFTGAQSVAAYSRALRALARDLAVETAQAAEEIEVVLHRTGSGHPLLLGLDTRIRARRVASRLRRAAECANGLAIEAVKFNTEFRTQFADAIEPRRRKPAKTFDFEGE